MDSTDIHKLSQIEHEQRLEDIKKETFRGKSPVQTPTIVVVGGQPGAGKSGIIELSKKDFPDGNVVIINGDEYRKFHPNSREIFKKHDKDYAKLTDPDVREWTRKLFDKAIEEKYNIIFEGTMRTEQIADTIKHLKEKGYDVVVRAAAVNELDSRAAIYQRYENQLTQYGGGRFTDRHSHDKAYTGMLKTLQRIEDKGLYDRLEIYKRNGELVYSSSGGAPRRGVVESVLKARTEPWSIEKYNAYIKNADELIKAMDKRGEKPEHIHAVKQLKESALERIAGIENAPAVRDLPQKIHYKTMFAAYAKETLAENGYTWTEQTNQIIAEKMLLNGHSSNVVKTAMKHSPEKVEDLHTFVREIQKKPEVKKTMEKAKGFSMSFGR